MLPTTTVKQHEIMKVAMRSIACGAARYSASLGHLSAHPARPHLDPTRAICIAAVQCSARAAHLHDNVAVAAPLIAAAAKSGADFVLLPEAFPQGYSYEPAAVWPFVDSIDLDSLPSPTRAPACAAIGSLAKQHGVWIGCTVLERGSGRAASDVFNTFVMLQPDGHLHPARHTKRVPAAFENLVFAPPDEARASRAFSRLRSGG